MLSFAACYLFSQVAQVHLVLVDHREQLDRVAFRVHQGQLVYLAQVEALDQQVHWDQEEQMVYLAVEGDLAHKVQQACLEDLDHSEDLVGCGMHFEF